MSKGKSSIFSPSSGLGKIRAGLDELFEQERAERPKAPKQSTPEAKKDPTYHAKSKASDSWGSW